MNDRFRFRTPIYGADGQFKKFIYWNAAYGFPAITAEKGDVFKEPEQQTGLKDKNGRLVYEGDVLATSNNNNDGLFDIWDKTDFDYTVVVWNKKEARFEGLYWNWEVEGCGSVYSMRFVEVIGNIHENSDLLEGSRETNN